jgi:hypothetical protein
MLIRFTCPAGHKIRADVRFAGRLMPCPACKRPTRVPPAAPAEIAESAAVRLLNECDARPAHPAQDCRPTGNGLVRPTKPCPRCKSAVRTSAEFCPECRVRLFPSTQAWKNVCRAAAERIGAN